MNPIDKKNITLNNGVKMPLVGFGTWTLRGDKCTKSVECAIACGYRLIDTAIMYGNEKEVGKAIRTSAIDRRELFITTKLNGSCNSYQKAKTAIEHSLEQMQLDYVDLFLIHEPYDGALEMYRALCEAYEERRIKAVGISNFNRRRYDLFVKECGILPAVNQIEAHVFYSQLDFISYLQKSGTAVQAWGPLAQGQNGIFSNPILSKIGASYGKSAAQAALCYFVQKGVSVVPKTKSPVRMAENLAIFDFTLTDAELAEIGTLNGNRTLSDWTEAWR